MHVFTGDGVVAAFGDVELVRATDDGEALVLPAEFALKTIATNIVVAVAGAAGSAGAVIGHDLHVEDVLLIRGGVVHLHTPVGIQRKLIGHIGALDAGHAGVGHAEIRREAGGELTSADGEALHGVDILLQPDIIEAGVAVVLLSAATRIGIANGKPADTHIGVELRAGAHEHIGTNPVAAELVVVRGSPLLEVQAVAAIGLHAGHLPLLAGGQGYLGHKGVLVLIHHEGVLHRLYPILGLGLAGQQSICAAGKSAAGSSQRKKQSLFHDT